MEINAAGMDFGGKPMPRAWILMEVDAAGMDFDENRWRGHGF